ncbi:hypothetical protein OJF2_27360 [Aquisphaera giovannonii]|uniref:Uncharacterized protein n=1 Tax=Aquisphaera giovannonii TaxID=406548 RepID=A0A5B9W1Y2_9BACT|nr:DUF5696 domain-containing protein [Aquisphaera giovannonii]QEH34201.1 hypothetical protein OJF2_27360 [Aquisphaera giovannonii]
MCACFLPLLVAALAARDAGADRLEIVPNTPVMRLDEVGLYRLGYAYRGKSEKDFPVGWSGPFDEQTGVACQPMGIHDGKEALVLHCPWRGGTGVSFQEFRVRIPGRGKTMLLGATAMRPEAVGKSDGVTFRIKAGGRTCLDVHRSDAAWKEFAIDLSGAAGTVLTIRFEVDPGPKDDSSFDFAAWGDRRLTFEGIRADLRPHLPAPQVPLASLLPRRSGGAVPPAAEGVGAGTGISRDGEAFVLREEGTDGAFQYRWDRPATGSAGGFLGTVVLTATRKGATPVRVPVADSAELRWAGAAKPLESRWDEANTAGPTLWRTFEVDGKVATVRIRGSLHGKALVFDVEADRPLAVRLAPGAWGPAMRRRTVPIPYMSGEVHYLSMEGLFVAARMDWTTSRATTMDGGAAIYSPLTDGRRNPLRERLIYAAAWNVDEVLPNIPNPPSPYLEDLGRRTVLDIWGGRYADIAARLESLASYGIEGGVAIIHDWQRSGYDNALPAHIPAASDKGGDEAMKALVATARRLGYRIALHENYVDYYPNYEGYREGDIALDSAGKLQKAWYNEGTKIQSFAVKPNAIPPLAATQSPEIHRRYGTNANYLDVHSAVPPWFHVDQRAGEAGAGLFSRVWDVHRELWAYERRTHGGPVLGEGNNHWYWSGCLDGVEAQFGQGWQGERGREVPLMVDFDLLKIHPLQLNHGMGYYERWWGKPTWPGAAPMVALDHYRMQEVAFGHEGFVGGASWTQVPAAWLEHNLLSPVTARHATARPAEIRYEAGGKWVDSSTAAASEKSGDAFQRVRIRYDNGLTITANQAKEPVHVGAHLLPQYGWLAEGAGVKAGTTDRDGVVSDYAETADSVFANARPAREWNLLGGSRVRPEVDVFEVAGPRVIRVTYAWKVEAPLARDHVCFVHFFEQGGPRSAILFQQDHALAVPTSKWAAGRTIKDGPHEFPIPAGIPDGDYAWTIGLYSRGDGRATLEGVQDGESRIRLGTLKVADGGRSLTFTREPGAGDGRNAIYLEHVNTGNRLLYFGPVRTDGGVVLRRAAGRWTAWVFPRDRGFNLLLDPGRFSRPARISCDGGRRSISPSPEGTFWRLPLNGSARYEWEAGGTP